MAAAGPVRPQNFQSSSKSRLPTHTHTHPNISGYTKRQNAPSSNPVFKPVPSSKPGDPEKDGGWEPRLRVKLKKKWRYSVWTVHIVVTVARIMYPEFPRGWSTGIQVKVSMQGLGP